MARTFRAVYKDQQGHTYSCPVEIHNGGWMLITTSGLAPITHTLDNQEHGIVTFDSYREITSADDRLHIEPRQPGQSSFRQLQEARAAHINAERKERALARAKAQNVLPDPAKAEAARQINNQYGALRNRHGIKNQ